MPLCVFATDLHGKSDRYGKLFDVIAAELPVGVFLGGDLFPSGLSTLASIDIGHQDFVNGYLGRHLRRLRDELGAAYPRVFIILGNDDFRAEEASMIAGTADGVWEYVHQRRVEFGEFEVFGYACVPPTPFLMKDWERYDVSRYVPPGCVSPEEGHRSNPVAEREIRYATIKDDLAALVGDHALERAIMLFHAPPYGTALDRAALDGKMVDHAPLDVHVGSVAIERFIRRHQPAITLHGHIHEAARLTGAWAQQIGRTYCFGAAHDGPELALVRFDPERPEAAVRTLI